MKIRRVRYHSTAATYSPEMRGNQHNYITTHSRAVHRNSHALAYCLVAHKCLYLKAHFAPEWWASVMSHCHPDKLVRYMGAARSEGVQFDTLNIENLTRDFTVTGDVVNQGLIGIKGIGKAAADEFAGTGTYTDIDNFIKKRGANKIVMERLIKLGAFRKLHPNSKATWAWYQFQYCTGKNITQLKRELRAKWLAANGWTEDTIKAEIVRQSNEYRKLYPKRTKIPPKITNWVPKKVYKDFSRDDIMELIGDDFTLKEILEFEKQYLGYHLHQPLDIYIRGKGLTIDDAKRAAADDGEVILEVMVVEVGIGTTKTGKRFGKMTVSDGIHSTIVMVWESELTRHNQSLMESGLGVSMLCQYNEERDCFHLSHGERILKLLEKGTF